MNIIQKLKETAFAILPVDGIVLILHFTLAPLSLEILFSFLVGSIFVILGLAIFLAGIDLGIVPAGSLLGAALTRTRNLPLILGAVVIVGFMITIAEPNLKVEGDLIESVTGNLGCITIVLSVSCGIGIFLAIAMTRLLLQIPFRLIVICCYGIALFLALFIQPTYVAIAFDSSGASTGPLTVPFFIALGIGVASVRGGKEADDDSFGTTGITAIGPILAIVVYGFILGSNGLSAPAVQAPAVQAAPHPGVISAYFSAVLPTMLNVAMALTPIAILLYVFHFFLLKLSPAQIRKMFIGIVYAWLGLVLFFIGANTGFIPAGDAIGKCMGALSGNWILIPIGCIFGAIIVCAEPAMWVLTQQVEEVSAGNISRPVLLISVAVGVSFGVGLSMWRVLAGFSIWYLIAPLFITALLLTFFSPKLFSSIAFDSGSVATGPVSSTFILPITLGASLTSGGNPSLDGFGLIAMIAIAPPISIQILGIIFHYQVQRMQKRKEQTVGVVTT